MIFDAEKFDFGRQTYDVAIVGAGAVGIMAALDLGRRGKRVLILEAGPNAVDAGSQRFFDLATSTGRKHAGLHEGRFRALGGTTNFWGGQLVRLDPIVFSPRPWVDEVGGWPIAFDEIEKYYDRCEDMLQVAEVLRADESVFRLAGIPSLRDDGHLKYFLTRWLTEKNFRVRFQGEMKASNGIDLVTGAAVVGLEADAGGENVVGLRVRHVDGREVAVTCRSIVLANGTIEIARLLQHPLADGRRPVWASNEWLGRGFMDHLEGTIGELKPRNRKKFAKLFSNIFVKGMKFQPRLRVTRSSQEKSSIMDFAIHVKFDSFNREHFDNAKIFFVGLLKGRFDGPLAKLPSHLWSAMKVGLPMMWNYVVNRRILIPRKSSIKLQVMIEQQQIRESRIVLSGRTDSLGMRIAELDWQVRGDKEMRTVRAAAAMAKSYFEDGGIADFEIAEEVHGPDEAWLDLSTDTFHHMGSTRMARVPAEGVVDPNCRVFGTNNLYVAGASVFPSAGFANPTFTAMALTLRLCDHLAGDAPHD